MYTLKRLWLSKDPKAYQQWQDLLTAAGLSTEEEVTYTVGIYDNSRLIATGSYMKNIIKCVAVCKDYQSENLLTQILKHLMEQLREEQTQLFVYTQPDKAVIFQSLGFKKIVATKEVLFMELGHPSFADYQRLLVEKKQPGIGAGIVMNANPFTKGHQYLVETAAKNSQQVYVFVLTENRSEFSTEERMDMVKLGTAHLPNVTVLPTEDYLVSTAVFPAYFLKENAPLAVAQTQAKMDATLFKEKIAPTLEITKRFVGEEPYSEVTAVYNGAMKEVFQQDIDLIVLPRLEIGGEIISATKVRQGLRDNNQELLKKFLPDTSYNYLREHHKM